MLRTELRYTRSLRQLRHPALQLSDLLCQMIFTRALKQAADRIDYCPSREHIYALTGIPEQPYIHLGYALTIKTLEAQPFRLLLNLLYDIGTLYSRALLGILLQSLVVDPVLPPCLLDSGVCVVQTLARPDIGALADALALTDVPDVRLPIVVAQFQRVALVASALRELLGKRVAYLLDGLVGIQDTMNVVVVALAFMSHNETSGDG